MAEEAKEKFLEASAEKASDLSHKKKLEFSFSNYRTKQKKAFEQFADLNLAKKRAGSIRTRSIENLDKYLIEFESNFIKNGGKLIWAQNTAEALEKISEIIAQHNPSFIIKSKSMVTEEIKLNEHLGKKTKVLETDLGEFIQQLSNEAPYHIVTPCLHKSTEDIQKLFSEKLNTPDKLSAEELTEAARKHLRQFLTTAEVGISGANFLVADSGAIAITENEGNAFFSASSSKAHIAITGVEKIIPSISQLQLFWPLLASHGTGQNITTFNHLISGPKKSFESEGPAEFYLILIDNGRSDLLEKTEQRKALGCIRCGACYNVCPVYKNIGGHAYGHVYGGPIGKVISPNLDKEGNFNHLATASTLCGACTEICPVDINLHELILLNRKDQVENNEVGQGEKLIWSAWKKAMLSRKKMDKGGSTAKNILLKLLFKKMWGKEREFPKVADKSFNQLMRERMNLK